MDIAQNKSAAETWFRSLRDRICARFEGIEASALNAPVGARSGDGRREPPREGGQDPARGAGDEGGGLPPFTPEGRTPTFAFTPWQRQEGGGGEIGLMKGRVFEKVGVNISTVTGEFSEAFRKEIPGAAEDPRFWASGISLVAHMASPKVPAAHFNTRMIVVGDGTRLWFGGGGDLNPMVENPDDTKFFHDAFRQVCNEAASRAHNAAVGDLPEQLNFYAAFAAWCDEYFYIPHRNESRGVGGIFYDYLGLNRLGKNTETIAPGQFGKGGLGKERTARGMETAANAPLDWQQCFDFTKAVGEAFLTAYPALIERHMHDPFTEAEREYQLRKRGRYAEYNLLYDRGTRFGLMTGGNPEAILMSLPPVAKWD